MRHLLFKHWQQAWHPLHGLTRPLSWLMAAAVALRRLWWRQFPPAPLRVPVVVVGNINVGGSGKTPVTLALVQALQAAGWHPGVVSRGYGGEVLGVRAVAPGDDPFLVGDEPALLAERTGAPVWVGKERRAAALALLEAHPECDILVCDDGLQHYPLPRSVEICVVNTRLGLGNGCLLPAGPLREPLDRLQTVNWVLADTVAALPAAHAPAFAWHLEVGSFYSLHAPVQCLSVEQMQAQLAQEGSVAAMAGLAFPEKFFQTLRGLGVHAREHGFPDHHRYVSSDLPEAEIILTTEKDAVKCRRFNNGRIWALRVEARLDPAFIAALLNGLAQGKHHGSPSA